MLVIQEFAAGWRAGEASAGEADILKPSLLQVGSSLCLRITCSITEPYDVRLWIAATLHGALALTTRRPGNNEGCEWHLDVLQRCS